MTTQAEPNPLLNEKGLEELRAALGNLIRSALAWQQRQDVSMWQRSRLGHMLAGLQTAEHCVTQLADKLKADRRKRGES